MPGNRRYAIVVTMDEFHEIRGQIAEYMEGLRAKGVTNPEQYEGALKKMETVDGAMWEKEN